MAKRILITGASSGIGEICARRAVAAGHRVALAARRTDRLASLVEELGGDSALAVECDVTDPEAQRAMFDTAVDAYGGLDVVFANAGLGASAVGTENGDIDNFRNMILVNNFAVTVTCKYGIPHGVMLFLVQWFIRGYAKNLSNELIEHGVRVTSIDPGMVETAFFDNPKPDALRPDDIAKAFLYVISAPPHARIAVISES